MAEETEQPKQPEPKESHWLCNIWHRWSEWEVIRAGVIYYDVSKIKGEATDKKQVNRGTSETQRRYCLGCKKSQLRLEQVELRGV